MTVPGLRIAIANPNCALRLLRLDMSMLDPGEQAGKLDLNVFFCGGCWGRHARRPCQAWKEHKHDDVLFEKESGVRVRFVDL